MVDVSNYDISDDKLHNAVASSLSSPNNLLSACFLNTPTFGRVSNTYKQQEVLK
jgi:hypothetical protein